MGNADAEAATVLLVDDHLLLIDLLGAYLGDVDPPMRVAKATSMPQALALVEQEPHLRLVVLDQNMPDMDGLTGLRHLKRSRPDLLVAILTGSPGTHSAARARELGAAGYIQKTIGAPAIAQALRRVLAGESYFPDLAQGNGDGGSMPSPSSQTHADGLSKREYDVLALLASGRPNKEIARTLGITPATVSFHLTQIYRKLGVNTRTEAVRLAFENGLFADRRA